jgi:hypothetical protein
MSELTTVLGKLKDTAPYVGREGYNVYPESDDWTPENVRVWLREAVARGDAFLLVSADFTGDYAREVRWLGDEACKLRMQARVLVDRALELEKAVSDAAKRAWDLEPDC